MVSEDSGFYVNTSSSISSMEFFYTPESIADSGLISTAVYGSYEDSNYSWASGTISSNNIEAIYVNGIDKTSETSVSNIFKPGNLHHVLVVFTAAVSDKIKINHSSGGSVKAVYQNISLYPSQFTTTQATNHYDMYVYKNYTIIQDDNTPSLSIAENSANYYDNDWVLFQTS